MIGWWEGNTDDYSKVLPKSLPDGIERIHDSLNKSCIALADMLTGLKNSQSVDCKILRRLPHEDQLLLSVCFCFS